MTLGDWGLAALLFQAAATHPPQSEQEPRLGPAHSEEGPASQLWALGLGQVRRAASEGPGLSGAMWPVSLWNPAGLRRGSWHSCTVARPWQNQPDLNFQNHMTLWLMLENWHPSVSCVGNPWTTVRWGRRSLTLPIPLGPLWPGLNRPVAG